jgi:predicted porin
MQKKIIALAVAGLVSGAAFAQSNVTVYGVADATFDFMHVSGGTDATKNISYNRVSTNSSLIGFKGAEDLGGGMKALFQYESAASFDAAGALGTSRDSFVGLTGGFGTVLLGNLTGPTRAFGAAVDVNAGATGIGANTALIGKLGNNLANLTLNSAATNGLTAVTSFRSTTSASAFDNRFQNAIAYVSPDFGGFTVIGGYVANENKLSGASGINTSAYDIGAKYANGPIMVGLSHAEVTFKNDVAIIGTQLKPKDTRLVGMYDFGMASVRVLWDQTKAVSSTVNVKQTVWGLGGTFNVGGSGKLIGQYYKAGDVSGTGGAANTGAKFYEVGYEHSLSKRTMIKAVYANLSNDSAAAYDFGVNATGLPSSSSNLDTTVSGLQIGLRHTF